MRRGLPIIAAVLAACGAAVTTADNAADASADVSQGSRRGKQTKQTRPPAEDPAIRQAREMEAAIEGGGMPGCFPPSLRGRQRAVAERLGGVPCGDGPSTTPSSAAGGDPWIGRYSDGEMIITRGNGPNRYAIHIETADAGCGGQITGTGTATRNRMTMIVPVQRGYRACRLDMDRQGSTLRVSQSGDCYLFYGGQCSFDGSYVRERSASAVPATRRMSVPQSRPAAQSASWIVGSWLLSGSDCAGPIGITYYPDGAYSTHMDSGRWQLTGNTLTHTTLETYTAGDAGSRRRVANPQPSRSQILSRTARSFVHRSPNGAARLERCS